MTDYVLSATDSDHSFTIHTGPVSLADAILLTEQHLAPNGWTPKLTPLTPPGKALAHFVAARDPQPVEHADLFVALRRAIICDPNNDGPDDRAATLVAHLQAHRPVQMWTGDEECLLAECGHDTTDGRCPDVEPAGTYCVACSAVYDTGSEYGPEWLAACRIEWPCQPIRATAAYYGVPLDGAAVTL